MRSITIPDILQINESYEDLFSKLSLYIKTNCIDALDIFCSKTGAKLIGLELKNDLNNLCKINFEIIDHTTEIKSKNSWILAIGGGKILDKCKYLAAQSQAKFISIPTLITHDGICSPVAVIDSVSIGAIMPSALFVPLYIIKESSIIQIHAGIGDLIANISAIEDWKLAAKHEQATIDDFAIMLSRRAVMNIVQMLELKINLREISFLKSLIESLTLSGIAMSIAGNSRPCSGAEHLISHAIDRLYGANTIAMHGIQVMVATIFLEKIRNIDYLDNLYLDTEIHKAKNSQSRLKAILDQYQLTTSFEDIGINASSLNQIIELAPSLRPERFTILNLCKMTPYK